MNERLHYIRKQLLAYSLEEFSDELGLDQEYLKKMESGEEPVSYQTIKFICYKYDINETWFCTGEGSIYAFMKKEYAEIISNLNSIGNDSVIFKFILASLRAYKGLNNQDRTTVDTFIKSVNINAVNELVLRTCHKS